MYNIQYLCCLCFLHLESDDRDGIISRAVRKHLMFRSFSVFTKLNTTRRGYWGQSVIFVYHSFRPMYKLLT